MKNRENGIENTETDPKEVLKDFEVRLIGILTKEKHYKSQVDGYGEELDNEKWDPMTEYGSEIS